MPWRQHQRQLPVDAQGPCTIFFSSRPQNLNSPLKNLPESSRFHDNLKKALSKIHANAHDSLVCLFFVEEEKTMHQMSNAPIDAVMEVLPKKTNNEDNFIFSDSEHNFIM